MSWQPIETAPKDGATVVLGGWLWVSWGQFLLGRWRMAYPPMVHPSRDNRTYYADEPTHWMPLPEPPK